MKPQDVLIALKIKSLNDQCKDLPQRRLAEESGISLSEVSAACRRLEAVGILAPGKRKIVGAALAEFLVHGLRYVFPLETGEVSRGMPTGYAAEPLRDEFMSAKDELVPVWPDPAGEVRGIAVQPLYKSVPVAARKDKQLYEYLALVDAIRGGRARERKRAIAILSQRLEE